MRAPRAVAARAVAAFVALASIAACSSSKPDRPAPSPSAKASSTAAAPPSERVVLDFIDALPLCDVDHEGPVLDLGTDALRGRTGWSVTLPQGVTSVEHDGSTWARVADRSFTTAFVLEDRRPLFVSARVKSLASKSAQVLLDDAPLGTLTLARDQIKIARTDATTLPVDAGLHRVTLRFSGRTKDAFADVDWLRVGDPGEQDAATYGAPTMRDVLEPAAALSGVPHRSLALRAPGSVRCAARAPSRGVLRVAIGALGAGPASAEIRALSDGKKPETLATVAMEGGEKASWRDVEVPLAKLDRALVSLELRAVTAPKGGRVLFGDPRLVVPEERTDATASKARAAVVVILDGVDRAELPPWAPAPTPHLAALGDLAQNGATFDRHRGVSTLVSSAVATIVTGLPPRESGLSDLGSRLPSSVTTIGAIARDASVRTAMFTGVPSTFRAFGMASGWEKFVELSPVSGDPATAPIDQAAQWIAEVAKSPESRMLVVVHARGGHPPWDVSSKELAAAPPPEYSGVIDPRTAGEALARFRKRARAALGEADRVRVRALETIALAGQDRAIGQLVQALKLEGLWDATLFVVTGDVASGADPDELFADGAELREPLLTLPLYVHFPDGAFAGKRVDEPTTLDDIPRTVLAALGVAAEGSKRRDETARTLFTLAQDSGRGARGPLVAEMGGAYSVRWADLVLRGRSPSPPRLCDLSIDATCAFDRTNVMPLAATSIFRSFAREEAASGAPPERERASIDSDTSAALAVWGAYD